MTGDREALVERIAEAMLKTLEGRSVWARTPLGSKMMARAALAVVEAEQGAQAGRLRVLVGALEQIRDNPFLSADANAEFAGDVLEEFSGNGLASTDDLTRTR